MQSESERESDPKARAGPAVSVAIPCYNEEAAIAAVVDEWRRELPAAEVVVFDNNSTDGGAAIAAGRGARVVAVPRQGKGWVVRRIFDELGDRDAVVMIDGDGTYPASAVGPLLSAVLDGRAEMAVGIRRPVAPEGEGRPAMSAVRGLGNVLINAAFRLLVGPGTSDLLSGYRVFSRSAMRAMRLASEGFEIETELAGEAVGRRLRVAEADVPYRPRAAGSSSKLRALRDGLRILAMIVRLGARLRPWRLLLLASAALAALGAASGSRVAWAAAAPVLMLAALSAAVLLARREAIGDRS